MCPSDGSAAPMPPRRVLEPENGRRILRQTTYSSVVAQPYKAAESMWRDPYPERGTGVCELMFTINI